ncbi:MAG: GtrA family protein [Ktedonobacteraceae bacterium]|nr:GtrA family protein [Ktedonobacteraceae bacterium]
MKSFLKRLFKMRIIRYGLVGGIGIPVNDLALLLFMSLMHGFYPLASACAFEISTTINFVLNQLFTYSEQRQHLSGWGWVRRAGKAQLTSLSALLLSYLAALVLVKFFQVNVYVANPVGIVVAFVYNFFISKKLVFQAPTPVEPQKAEVTVSQ